MVTPGYEDGEVTQSDLGPHLPPHKKKATVGERVAWYLGLGFLAAFALTFVGCVKPAPIPVMAKQIVIPDSDVEVLQKVSESLFGYQIAGLTLPGGITLLSQKALADNPCLQAHEGEHLAQQLKYGVEKWTALYGGEMFLCLARANSKEEAMAMWSTCYWWLSWEREARAVEAACKAKPVTP